MYQSKIAWARTQLSSKFGQDKEAGRVLLGVISELEAKIADLEKAAASAKKTAAKKPAAKKPAAK